MSGFIEWLETISKTNAKVRAVLKRSLAFHPGCFPPAYPYVEPFLKGEDGSRKRETFYLIAGLWALHWRERRGGGGLSIGKAAAHLQKDTDSSSIEHRFIALLDADEDQLPYRLRQMVSLLKEAA